MSFWAVTRASARSIHMNASRRLFDTFLVAVGVSGRMLIGGVYKRTRPNGSGGKVQTAEIRLTTSGCLGAELWQAVHRTKPLRETLPPSEA